MPGRARTSTMPSIVHHKDAPASPPRPAVSFQKQPVTKISRPVTNDEHHAIFDFEMHAARCAHCYEPYKVYKRGELLCDRGNKLASTVSMFLYSEKGEVLSKSDIDTTPVLVELPNGYKETPDLLKAVERSSRHSRRTPFVTSTYAVRAPERRRSVKVDQERRPRPLSGEIVDWPTEAREPSTLSRRATISVNNTTSNRGSLYEADIAQQQRDSRKYNLVVREPTRGVPGYHR